MAIVMIFTIAGCSSEGHEGEAKTPSGSSIQKSKDYQKVVDEFESSGFTNIKLEKLDDLVTGWLTKDGEVESVSVDGDVKYSADRWYKNDVEVVITYHTFPKEKDSSDEVEVTKIEETPAVTDSQESKDTIEKPKDLKEHVAKKAFEIYGETLYPYGFKCHWFKSLEAHEQSEDGSWYFKVGVTITNEYGASKEAVASGYINNTTEAVENFIVE